MLQQKTTHRLALIFGALLLLLTYATTYVPTYLVVDDFQSLSDVYSSTNSVADFAFAQGRILNGIFIYGLFDLFNSVEQGKYIRLVGVMGTCVTFCLLAYLLSRQGYARVEAFTIALTACLLPPFVEVALFAGIASYSWSCVIALSATILLESSLNPETRGSDYRLRAWVGPLDISRFVWATVVLVLALLSYPPATQLVFCLPLLYLLQPGAAVPIREALRCYALAVGSFFVAGLAFVLIWKTYQYVFFADFWLPPGRGLVSSPTEFLSKVIWFIRDVPANAANLFKFVPRFWIGATVTAICLAQFAFAHGPWKERLLRALLWTSLLFAAYAANILAKETWPSYRSQLALQVFIWISFATPCIRMARAVASKFDNQVLARSLVPACCTLFVVILALRQFLLVGPAVTQPHANEWEVVKNALSKIEGELQAKRIVVVRPEWGANRPALVRFDTIGQPSSSAAWVPGPMMNVAYWELFKRPLALPVQHLSPEEFVNHQVEAGDFVLDLNALLLKSAALRQRPFPKRASVNPGS